MIRDVIPKVHSSTMDLIFSIQIAIVDQKLDQRVQHQSNTLVMRAYPTYERKMILWKKTTQNQT